MVGYLGPVGTFSYMAAKEYYKGREAELKEYPSIYTLIKAVDNREIESAIVPAENSIDGSVNTTLDTIAFESKVYICGEYVLKVSENLIAKKGTKKEEIKKIISHPQPIGQCSKIINSQFPNVKIEYTESTAAAARIIAAGKDNSVAMIGPSACAQLYGLEIIEKNCGDEPNNCTRFIEIKKEQNTVFGNNDKSSFIISTDNNPGCLFRVVEAFAKNNVNMCKIESRPAKKKLGVYIFFIDIDGNIAEENIKKALNKIKSESNSTVFLGSYKKG
ncbi:MAG: prephenate dehydratase [Clostridia bacterium]|nr:prephenate dehydratase [Clostridia bacterium]